MNDYGKGIVLMFQDANSKFSVMFDDDGRVAYAYLYKHKNIISDVWLYNLEKAPDTPEWTHCSGMPSDPFLNASEYTSNSLMQPVKSEDEIKVLWKKDNGKTIAEIYIRDKLHGKLCEGIKPGWSILAVKDGPLAKVLNK